MVHRRYRLHNRSS